MSLRKQPSFRWAPQGHAAQSPTRPTPEPVHDSPRQSPHIADTDLAVCDLLCTNRISTDKIFTQAHLTKQPKLQPSIGEISVASTTQERPRGLTRNASSQSITANPPVTSAGSSKDNKPASRDGGDANPYKSFKVTLDDPCWKVLPAALKKYKISDDWQHYAMFICYGNTGALLLFPQSHWSTYRTYT